MGDISWDFAPKDLVSISCMELENGMMGTVQAIFEQIRLDLSYGKTANTSCTDPAFLCVFDQEYAKS